jgi:hypothetical protein
VQGLSRRLVGKSQESGPISMVARAKHDRMNLTNQIIGCSVNNHIYQIFYSPETHANLDPGFIPLDNTGQRPDWYEYWPIRNFLQNETLDENTRYGFLSPKFSLKTGLQSGQVMSFLGGVPSDVDVVTFSPFLDHTALFLNVFEQMGHFHPECDELTDTILKLLAPGVQKNSLVMSSANTIFCNYFVAKPAFWRRWLEKCEIIFSITENPDDTLGKALNASAKYDLRSAPAKVFFIERMASLLLSIETHWKVRNFNITQLRLSSNSPLATCVTDLIAMDALKRVAHETGHFEYLSVYALTRTNMLEKLSQKNEKGPAPQEAP